MLEWLLRLEGIKVGKQGCGGRSGGGAKNSEGDLDVRIARELLEKARADGVLLVGPRTLDLYGG
jgi:hypothetical protein